MGTRFIHKNGKTIPIHSDHGDQQAPQAQHAAPANPPANPAPVAGHESSPHPAPMAVKRPGNMEGLKKAREAREYNKAHPVQASFKRFGKKLGL